jgi:hypothetical protein
MTAAICPLMHNAIADSIYNSIVSKSAKYYYFLGKTVPYTLVNGVEQVETPMPTYKYELATRRDIISLKQITNNDVSYVVPRIDWTYDEVYDYYDDSYGDTVEMSYGSFIIGNTYTIINLGTATSLQSKWNTVAGTTNITYDIGSSFIAATNGSILTDAKVNYVIPSYTGATSINEAKFYVLTSNNNVYMCLDNNNNAKSTIMPTGYDILPFVTSDGYKWKYMMNLPLSLRTKFLTGFYMPVTNAVNNIFYNNGAIDSIIIDNAGSGYPSNTTAAIAVTSPEISNGSFVVGQMYTIANLGTAASLQSKWNTAAGTTGITYSIGSTFTAATNGSNLTGAKIVGYGAILKPRISSIDGSISLVTITNGGRGYPSGTTLTVTGTGTGKFTGNATALLTPVIVNGVITHAIINDPGKDYNSNATNLTIQSTTGVDAHLTAIVESGQIVDVIIDNPGYGYKDAKITATGVGGTNARLIANVSGGELDTIQANVELMTVDGSIDYIKVIDGGYGYTNVVVTISGDGHNATAESVLENGILKSITITNRGYGYTYATVTLTPNGGINSVPPTARAIISPKYGHGKNALSELFANTLMFYSTITQDNSTGFTLNNDYRQFGILKNPTQFDSTQLFFNKNGSACYSVNVTISNGTVLEDMILTDSSGYQYIVIAKTSTTSLLLHPKDNSVLTTGITLTNGIISVVIDEILLEPTIDRYSGDLLYIDNRSAFYQTEDQTVTLQTILKF